MARVSALLKDVSILVPTDVPSGPARINACYLFRRFSYVKGSGAALPEIEVEASETHLVFLPHQHTFSIPDLDEQPLKPTSSPTDVQQSSLSVCLNTGPCTSNTY